MSEYSIDGNVRQILRRLAREREQRGESSLPVMKLAWRRVAGPFLADQATPIGLRKGVLRIRVEHPALGAQIKALEPDLLPKLEAEADMRLTRLETVVRKRRRPASTHRSSGVHPGPVPEETVRTDAPTPPLPEVREELRPQLERLWRLHHAHKKNRGSN